MIINKIYWLLAKKVLHEFSLKEKLIDQAFIRHSAAFGAQNPFLSDIDVTLFIKASDFQSFLTNRAKVTERLAKEKFLSIFVQDVIMLPATKNARELCRKYYPFRSVYPFDTWCSPNAAPAKGINKIKTTLPLDHAPENSFFYYLMPVILGQKPPHRHEKSFLQRKIAKDAAFVELKTPLSKNASFNKSFLSDINLWSSFYDRLNFSNQNQALEFKSTLKFDYQDFQNRWNQGNGGILKNIQLVSSVWIYPSWRDENLYNVVININLNILDTEFENLANEFKKLFQGLRCSLIFGTESTMLGRINGLSRLNFIEPWLFKYYGHCLQGNYAIKDKISLPSIEILKEKFNELFFYFFYDLAYRNLYGYEFYQACFVFDHLLKTSELCLDEGAISRIYGQEFITKDKFNPNIHTPQLLNSLKKFHNISFFDII